MRKAIYLIFITLIVASARLCIAAGEMHAGVAVVDITAPVPFRMAGYYVERLSTGTKDPLHAKAVVFQQGEQRAAVVFCDLIGISEPISTEVRTKASEKTGIPKQHIAIAATHAHTGPLLFGSRHDFLHDRRIARFGEDPYESSAYRSELVKKLVSAIDEANSSRQPVLLKGGSANQPQLAFNRRYHMKDGSVRFNPGNRNPNIVRPAGPTDPQIGIVLLQSPDGTQPSAAVVAFAMHLDTLGGTEYSADYPKFTEDRLRKSLGPEFTLLFGAGTCGDINDIDVTAEGRRSTAELGTMLGETIEKAVLDTDQWPVAEPALAVRSREVKVPLQSYSEAEIAEARKKMDLFGTRELPFLKQVEASKILDLQRWKGSTAIALEVQIFRLNRDTALVMLPGEVFVELGLAIKAASPFKNTLVIELTNESLGYIPTRKAFVEGSYETINSRVQPGGGETLVQAAIELLNELR